MQSRALVTLGTGSHARWLAYTSETFRQYALKHRYEYVQGCGEVPDLRPAPWAKIPLLQRLLKSFELVVWIDADAIILDDTRDIASELTEGTWQALVGHRWGEEFIPNTGVWVLRRSPRTEEFLRAVWNSVDFIDQTWYENAAVMNLLGFTYTSPVRLVNPSASWLQGTQWLSEEWNRISFYTRRLEPARIRHLAGEPPALRARQMRADAALLNGHRLRPFLSRIEWVVIHQRSEHPLFNHIFEIPLLNRIFQSVRYRLFRKPRQAVRNFGRRLRRGT